MEEVRVPPWMDGWMEGSAACCEDWAGGGEGRCWVGCAGATVTFDEEAACNIVTYDTDQWVSWDDAETLKLKIDFANQRCLGG